LHIRNTFFSDIFPIFIFPVKHLPEYSFFPMVRFFYFERRGLKIDRNKNFMALFLTTNQQ